MTLNLIVRTACWVLIIIALTSIAMAGRANTRYHCQNDYAEWCAAFKPYSPASKKCMRRNLPRLSYQCKRALKQAGYRR